MNNSEILALANLRVDGRKPCDVRKIRYNFGVEESADGSVYYEQGLNKVLVCVHGPQEPLRRSDASTEVGSIVCRYINAPFSGFEHKQRRTGDRKSLEIEKSITESYSSVIQLELYPRSEIVIVVHVLESDGSSICTVINAITLALIDAGICMTDMLVSCSAGFVREALCRDISQTEMSGIGACLPVAIKARTRDIVFAQLENRLSLESLEAALREAVDGCVQIHGLLQVGVIGVVKEAIARRTESTLSN